MTNTLKFCLKIIYLILAFCSALIFGAIKSILVGPIASLIWIIGNVGVILGLFPAHVVWTIFTLVKTNRYDAPLKLALLLCLPGLFGIWLSLSIAATVLVGFGYGFFTPWISSFEAFRHDKESKQFLHCVMDGTWGTIKGSCTVVRDFADMCYHSYPVYLKELREAPCSNDLRPLKFIHVPACIIVGVLGVILVVPLCTAIAIVKSPYMLYKGWQRLIHDLVSREGPFLETACIPIAGLTILLWPLIVLGSIALTVFSSIFIGLYGSFIVYQERSFKKGVAYVVASVAEFDEYTNDQLYLREGSILPKPRYRKKKASQSTELSVGGNRVNSLFSEAPPMLMPSLTSSRSVREAIQEVKMVQVWGHLMKSCEARGKELLDRNVITTSDLHYWLKSKNSNEEVDMIGVGLPCYAFFQNLMYSIKSGSNGILLHDDLEITHLNRPQGKLLDWFFQPIMVLKEQIKVLSLRDEEIKFLEKTALFGNNVERIRGWENGGLLPEDPVRAAQIEGISRRMMGMIRSTSKFPTYRRRFRHVIKELVLYSSSEYGDTRTMSTRSAASV